MDDSKNAHLVFNHLNAPNGSVYRAIMKVFRDAKAEYTLHLRPKDVFEGIADLGFERPLEQEVNPSQSDWDWLALLLNQLEQWGNLRSYQDTVEVATVNDFLRKRFLYQMTAAGEAAENALLVFEEQLGKPGELQATALEDIEEKLKALRRLAQGKEIDPAQSASLLGEL